MTFIYKKLFKFISLMGINSFLNLLLYFSLITFLDNYYYNIYYFFSCFLITIFAYFTSKRFVFNIKSKSKKMAINFFLSEGCITLSSIYLLYIFVEVIELNLYISSIIVFSSRFIISFLWYNFIVFKN